MKNYYVNYCVARVHTQDPRDHQAVIELPDGYVPSEDKGLTVMRRAVDEQLLFYTEQGEGITIKSFSRMDL